MGLALGVALGTKAVVGALRDSLRKKRMAKANSQALPTRPMGQKMTPARYAWRENDKVRSKRRPEAQCAATNT